MFQMTKAKKSFAKRPGRLLRTLFRLPLMLYRLDLGSLMPMQILLTTVGRRTKRRYKVVVDIIEHDKTKDTYYISAAYGPRSDWYLNLRAYPIVQAQIGRCKFMVRTNTLPLDEAEDLLVKFVRLHPHYVRIMMRVVGMRIGWSERDVRNLALKMPIIACTRISF
jgi:deazaflavin-dependent oxidoreductase (nitroreductase family)